MISREMWPGRRSEKAPSLAVNDGSGGVQPFGAPGPSWKSCLGPHIKHTNTDEN